MSERKNIDRLFQEKFKDFEADPSEQSWKIIEARLKAKKDRKVIPFWFKLSGIAAALLIGLFITDRLIDHKNVNSNNVNSNAVVVAPKSGGNENTKTVLSKRGPVSGHENNAVTVSEKPAGTIDSSSGKTNTAETTGTHKSQHGQTKGGPIFTKGNTAVATSERSNKRIGQHATTEKPNRPTAKAMLNMQDNSVAATAKGGAVGHNKMGKSRHKNANLLTQEQNEPIAETSNKKHTAKHNKKSTAISPAVPYKTAGEQLAENAKNSKNTTAKNIENKVTEIKTQTQAIAATDQKKAADGKTKNDSTAVATVGSNALGELLHEKESKSVTESGQKINRWQLYTHVAPIYLSSASDGSSIDPTLAKNAKEYKTSMSYGIGMSYAISKKFAVRAGVNSVSMEYNTNDIVFGQSLSGRDLAHVNTNISGALLNIQSTVAPPPSSFALANLPVKNFTGSLNQKTAYIEVPVELSYKLVDKKVGVDVIGGLSTLFLQQNDISLISDGSEMSIGKADNLNSTHFSGNLGLGLKYSILKSLQFNFEPMLKYQINTYSSGDFKPYFFGLYTGLNYRF
jgi:hypothetical protein